MHKIEYGKFLPDVIDMERTEAIILLDGNIYTSSINHQCCLEDAVADVFKSKGWNIEEEKGLGNAIRYTDNAFRNNEMFGFDVWEDGENKYLLSHYEQNLENEECYKKMKQYALEKGMILGTFICRDKCSIDESREVA